LADVEINDATSTLSWAEAVIAATVRKRVKDVCSEDVSPAYSREPLI
jgi:hypothetical protein